MPAKSLLGAVEAASTTHRNLYDVEIQFINKILGTQPKSDSVMEAWLKSKKTPDEIVEAQVARSRDGLTTDELEGQVDDEIETAKQGAWTGFFHNQHGPYIGTYQVKAMLRELVSSLGITVAQRGSKQTLQHLFSVVALDPATGEPLPGEASEQLNFYRLDDKGEPVIVSAVDGFDENTAHVRTPAGSRSVIKRHDYVKGARLRFRVGVVAKLPHARKSAAITDDNLAVIFAHAGDDSLGAGRSQLYGRFEVVRLDKLTDNPHSLAKPGRAKGGSKAKGK